MGQSGVAACVFKVGFALALPLFMSACSDGKDSAAGANKPLPGIVAEVVTEKDVSDETTFVGQTRSSQSVDIRARVKGTLLKRPFEEGHEVQEGAVLYEIDPAQFQADLLAAEATLAKAKASAEEKNLTLKRYQILVDKNSPGVSEAQYDIALSQAKQADAEVSAGQADVENAKINLGYATITSPLKGRAGISTVDVGNIIGPDNKVLVTVLALDPIEVDFSVGERIYLDYMEKRAKGTTKAFTPQIRLADGKLYPHPGKVYVVNNEVDPATGTIAIRLMFPNPDQLLLPGQYVTVLLTEAKPEKQVVVPQAAVQQNQSGPFVLVVDSADQVKSRAIKTGQRVGTGIVVKEGLMPGETIVVEGIQKVRPGAKVKVTYQDPSGTAGNVNDKPVTDQAGDVSDTQSSDKSAPDAKGSDKKDAAAKASPKDTKSSGAASESDKTSPAKGSQEKKTSGTEGSPEDSATMAASGEPKDSDKDQSTSNSDGDVAPSSKSEPDNGDKSDDNTEAKQ